MDLSTEIDRYRCPVDESDKTFTVDGLSPSPSLHEPVHIPATNVKLSKNLQRKLNEFTMHWLEENYECQEGICLPRCLLYKHYIHYMRVHQQNVKPIGAAAFGKLVRQKFPKITTRRLGTRGQSKYHYYGIGIRKCSPFYQDQKSVVFSQSSGNFVFKRSNSDSQIDETTDPEVVAHWNKSNIVPSIACHSYCSFSADSDDYRHLYQPTLEEHRRQNNATYSNLRNSNSSKAAKRRSKFLMLHSFATVNQSEESGIIDQTENISRMSTCYTPEDPRCKPSSDNDGQISVITNNLTLHSSTPSPSSYNFFQNNYPSIHDFNLPNSICISTLSTFLVMYKSHCHRIIDTFQLANVEELEKTVTHFWNKMPVHLAPLLANPYLSVIIETVDTLLYRTVEEYLSQLSLMPDMSTSFVTDIEHILKDMKHWIGGSILGTQSRIKQIVTEYMVSLDPETLLDNAISSNLLTIQTKVGSLLVSLVKCKVDAFDQFALAVRKQIKFYKMSKNCRTRLSQAKCCALMIEELNQVCPDNIEFATSLQFDRSIFNHNEIDEQLPIVEIDKSDDCVKSQPTDEIESQPTNSSDLVKFVHVQFGSLLKYFQKIIDFEQILRWSRSIIEKCILKANWSSLTSRSQALLYSIDSYALLVMRDLTVNGSKSLKLWNLVFMCLKEYILLEVSRAIRYEKQSVLRDNKKNLSLLNEHIHSSYFANNSNGKNCLHKAYLKTLQSTTRQEPIAGNQYEFRYWPSQQPNLDNVYYRPTQPDSQLYSYVSNCYDGFSQTQYGSQCMFNTCVNTSNLHACVLPDQTSPITTPMQASSHYYNNAIHPQNLSNNSDNSEKQLDCENSPNSQFHSFHEQNDFRYSPFNTADESYSQNYAAQHQSFNRDASIKWSEVKWPNFSREKNPSYQSVYVKNCLPVPFPARDVYNTDHAFPQTYSHSSSPTSTYGSNPTELNSSRLVTSEEGNVYTCLT